jgi:hypothetical protein
MTAPLSYFIAQLGMVVFVYGKKFKMRVHFARASLLYCTVMFRSSTVQVIIFVNTIQSQIFP